METVSVYRAQVDLNGIGAWRSYAASLEAGRPALERRPMPSWNAFLALATRILMIDPAAPVPLRPPTSAFTGDAVGVTVSGSPSFACERRGQGGESGGDSLSTPLPPPLTGVKGGGARVRFLANRANAPGVVTELMLQGLASVGRAPVADRYRSQGFVAFAEGSLEAVVPFRAGWVACAVRFVDAATGQATAVFPCGIVRVGAQGGSGRGYLRRRRRRANAARPRAARVVGSGTGWP